MKKNNVISLTRQLVSIPSFVDQNNNEAKLGEFIVELITKNSPNLSVEKQYLSDNSERFNVYIGNPNPDVLFVGHMDTVQIQPGWTCDPFIGSIKNGLIYGLGAADMKGSIGAFLCALFEVQKKINIKRLGILLYCDEEYDFAGMKAYIKSPKKSPKIIVSLDGQLQLSSGCRGLIEISGTTFGKSGHSSKPFAGTNAITKTVEVFRLIDQDLSRYFDPILGQTTTNLAYLNGGSLQGNIIPNRADFIFEVRVSRAEVNASMAIRQLKKFEKLMNVKFSDIKIRHDLVPWPPAYDSECSDVIISILKRCDLSPIPMPRDFSGYIDTAMLESIYPAVPKFVFGVGGKNQHSPNEYTLIDNLNKAQKVYEQLLINL